MLYASVSDGIPVELPGVTVTVVSPVLPVLVVIWVYSVPDTSMTPVFPRPFAYNDE